LHKYEERWNSLFPIHDDPGYQDAVRRIEERKKRIVELQEQIEKLS